MPTVLGVDVSNWNGSSIDWPAVAAAGYTFSFAKASEGTGFRDGTFARNWQGIAAAQMIRGAYHFARPGENAPEAEADVFLAQLAAAGGLAAGDLLALDMEAGSGNLLPWTLDWLTYVTAAVGFRPLLYSGRYFMEPNGLTGSAELGQYGLWLAAYQYPAPNPPPGWDFWAIWQQSDSGSVPGIAGAVDTDLFNGTRAQLLRYGKPAAPPDKPALDDSARLLGCRYLAGGSGVSDMLAWLEGYRDAE